MNKLTKIGVSALAGSLAVVSANATEYVMSGGMTTTFSTQDSPSGLETASGKGFGLATDLGFTASGELDNGYTVTAFMSVDTDTALTNTSSQLTVGMGSLGTLQLNNIAGSKANGIDDVTPNAYNETWDGLSPDNISFFGSLTSSGSLDYRIPAQEFMGTTINASATFDPNASGGHVSKAGVSSTTIGGHAYTLQLAHESGVEIGGGIESVNDGQGKPLSEDTDQYTAYIKYATGGISVAYQEAWANPAHGTITPGADKEAAYMGIAYTTGDLTLSYGESEQKTDAVATTAALPTIKLDSVQAAYVMGAMTISAAVSETSNTGGVQSAEYNENTLAVSFAF